MKQPKKPIRRQKEIIRDNMLVVNNWFVVSETEFYLHLINRNSGKKKIITKYPKREKKISNE